MDSQPELILTQLRHEGIIQPNCVLGQQMLGTTEGRVYVVNLNDQPSYVLKMDAPMYIKIVTDFLQAYKGSFIPRLHFTDPNNEYYIYEYVVGVVNKDKGPKSKWLTTLSESLINRYEHISAEKGWGWLEEPLSDSWSDFLQRSIVEARIIIGGLLPEEDYDLVMQIPRATYGSGNPDAYFIHGDCGVHNFIFDSSILKGVIDPTPMIGPPLYDFIFAFCSSPDELTMDTLLGSVGSLKSSVLWKADQRFLIEEVLVQLYCRIGTCLKYHSHHLSDYLKAWTYWRNLRNEAIK
jgi:hypothetical protein